MNAKNLNDKEKIEAILENFQLNIAEFSRNIDVKLDTIFSIFYEKTKPYIAIVDELKARNMAKFNTL